jgi:RNA polymerase sigma-70 factor (ECF subfamily)
MKTEPMSPAVQGFEALFAAHEIPLRRALVAAYGHEDGREAAAEAWVWAWEHYDRLRELENPAGYLYRVGQSKARKWLRRPVRLPDVETASMPSVEPKLPGALRRLSMKQRQVVVLRHAYDTPRREVAELLGISPATVDTHLARGLAKLRAELRES